MVTYLLILSVNLQPVFQSSSEVARDMRVWGQSGTCSLQGLINVMGVLKQPSCRKLACWLAKEAKTGGKGPRVFPMIWKA